MKIFLSFSLLLLGTFLLNQSTQKSSPTRSPASLQSIKSDIEIKNLSDLKKYAIKTNSIEVQFRGILEVEITENYNSDEEHSIHKKYFVRSQSGVTQKIEVLNPEEAQLALKQEVDISAIAQDDRYYGFIKKREVKTTKTNKKASFLRDDSNVEKMLVLLVNFSNSIEPDVYPNSPQVEASTFASNVNNGAYNKYFTDVTKSRARNTVTRVEDWYTFNRNYQDTHHPSNDKLKCYVNKTDIKRIIQDRNINVSSFDNISVIVNCAYWSSWGVASSIYVQGKRLSTASMMFGARRLHFGASTNATPGMNKFVRIYIHERLHNYGISHAGGIDCNDKLVPFPCSHVVYGNAYDAIGHGESATAMNADALKRKGWRDDKNYAHIHNSGTFKLNPLLSKSNSAKIAAYIYSPFSRNNKPVFMLENRAAMSIDNQLSAPEYQNVRNGLALYTSLSTSKEDPKIVSPVLAASRFRIMDPAPQNQTLEAEDYFPERMKLRAISRTEPFFDPITGIRVEILPKSNDSSQVGFFDAASTNHLDVNYRVTYEPQNRICFKEELKHQISDVFIQSPGTNSKSLKNTNKNSKVSESSKTFTVTAGEQFTFRFLSHMRNPAYCPREKVGVQISDSNFYSWAKDIHRPTPRPGQNFEVYSIVSDYTNTHQLGSTYMVSPDATEGLRTISVKYFKRYSLELIEKEIRIYVKPREF